MVRLIIENNKETVHRIENNLGMAITDICLSMYRNNLNRFLLLYQSSFKSHNDIYYICFKSVENDDRYTIVSDKFISLKDIDLLMKTTAKASYVADGGAITEYGVFEK